MAPILPLMMPTYISDLGITYRNVKFKIKRGRADIGNRFGDYSAITGLCPGVTILKPRAVIATFTDGERVRYPVASPDGLLTAVRTLIGNAEVECVDLDGETWGVIPPTIGGYTPRTEPYGLPAGKSEKNNGSYDYTSDVLGLIGDRYSYEANPPELTLPLMDCLQNRRVSDACFAGSGIKARRIIVKANGNVNNTISRIGKVSTLAGIRECIQAMNNRVLCIGYKGETIRNVHLLVEETAGPGF